MHARLMQNTTYRATRGRADITRKPQPAALDSDSIQAEMRLKCDELIEVLLFEIKKDA